MRWSGKGGGAVTCEVRRVGCEVAWGGCEVAWGGLSNLPANGAGWALGRPGLRDCVCSLLFLEPQAGTALCTLQCTAEY